MHFHSGSLLFFLLILEQTRHVLSVCCSSTGWLGCCGLGDCNVFCCNCDGDGCRSICHFDPTLTREAIKFGASLLFGRRKRDMTPSSISKTWQRFDSIDNDKNGFLDVEESILWLSRGKPLLLLKPTLHILAKNQSTSPPWFKRMDKDENGLISPNEFDDDLSKPMS